MGAYTVDESLQARFTAEEWAEYVRLTDAANNPKLREMPATRAVFIGGSVVVALLIAATVVAVVNASPAATGLSIAVIVAMFATPGLAIFTVLPETRNARERAAAARRALVDSVTPEPSPEDGGGYFDRPAPHYPVTGTYDPALYIHRGGREYARWLEDTGYGDHETYEANKPD